jgi:hypothetical protein
MALYWYLIDAETFRRLRAALGDTWRRRTFESARPFCADLLGAAETFRERYRLGPDDFLTQRVAAGGLLFDREVWRCLVGEVVLLAASDVPEADDALDGLRRLLAPNLPEPRPAARGELHPLEQAHRGSRDLLLGGAFYRPDHAGLNDPDDVARLMEYLAGIDPAAWSPEALAGLEGMDDLGERGEELAYLRQCFAALRDLYGRALAGRHVVVCETLG